MCKIMKPWSVLATKKAMVVVVVIARVLVSEFLVLNCFWEKMRHRKDRRTWKGGVSTRFFSAIVCNGKANGGVSIEKLWTALDQPLDAFVQSLHGGIG